MPTDNVVPLRKPEWQADIENTIGPEKIRAFVFLALTEDGTPGWCVNCTGTDSLLMAGLAQSVIRFLIDEND